MSYTTHFSLPQGSSNVSIGSGGAGGTVTSIGAGTSLYWNNVGTNAIATNTSVGDLEVKGKLTVTDDITLHNGDSLSERLERIETLLQIPTRDVTIESQYPKLRELYEAYMRELEKYKTWNRLKSGTENGKE